MTVLYMYYDVVNGKPKVMGDEEVEPSLVECVADAIVT